MMRSVISIFAGYLTMAVLVMIATVVSAKLMLHASGTESLMNLTPTRGFIVVNLIYSGLFAVLGGFVTAVVARRAPLAHALVLAAVMLLLGIAYLFSPSGNGEPQWYRATLVVLGPASATLGGYIQRLRMSSARRPESTPVQT